MSHQIFTIVHVTFSLPERLFHPIAKYSEKRRTHRYANTCRPMQSFAKQGRGIAGRSRHVRWTTALGIFPLWSHKDGARVMGRKNQEAIFAQYPMALPKATPAALIWNKVI